MAKNLLPGSDKMTVLGEKVHHVGALHGMIEAGGQLPLGTMFGIRFLPKGNGFTVIQVVTKGVANSVGFSYTPRPKIVHVNKGKGGKVKEKELIKFEKTEETLF